MVNDTARKMVELMEGRQLKRPRPTDTGVTSGTVAVPVSCVGEVHAWDAYVKGKVGLPVLVSYRAYALCYSARGSCPI